MTRGVLARATSFLLLVALVVGLTPLAFSATNWTDGTLTPYGTKVRKVHIDELRSAVNAKRTEFGQSAVSWPETIVAYQTPIRKSHIDDLRAALTSVATTYNPICPSTVPAAPAWGALTAYSTKISASHITQLRQYVDDLGTCDACCGGGIPGQECQGGCTGTGCGVRNQGDEGSPACPTCQDCDGSGLCAAVSPINTQDVGCATICRACQGGTCGNALDGTDPGNLCANPVANTASACYTGVCSGGACQPATSGTDCGVCQSCNGAGACNQLPAGDTDCTFPVNCASYYVRDNGAYSQPRYCHSRANVTGCLAQGNCPTAAGNCPNQPKTGTALTTCGACKKFNAGDCTGTTLGGCTDNQGTTEDFWGDCSAYRCLRTGDCDGLGGCEVPANNTDPNNWCPNTACRLAYCDGDGGCQKDTSGTGYLCQAACDYCNASGVCDSYSNCCGNGTCESGETCTNCSADCGCGSQLCCSGVCKNCCANADCANGCDKCNASGNCVAVTCGSCQQCNNNHGCQAITPCCGNGTCESGENCTNCSADCGCGSQLCCSGVCKNCCGNTDCADGCDKCNASGNCVAVTCGSCQQCNNNHGCEAVTPCCGNGSCESGETCSNCAADCGCSGQLCCSGQCKDCCSNSNCGACETCSGGACQAVSCGTCQECNDNHGCRNITPCCGNGSCESGENCSSCSADCGCPGQTCCSGVCKECCTSADCGGNVCCIGVCCEEGEVCRNSICDVPACFVSGTKILTPQGLVAIEALTEGDEVYSVDPATHEKLPRRIVAALSRPVESVLKIEFSNGLQLKVTAEHPFWDIDRKLYRKIAEFKPGDRVLYLKNWDNIQEPAEPASLTIQKMNVYMEKGTVVHNITVEGPPQNFIAEGVVVHNKL